MTIDTQDHSNDMIQWLSEQVTVLDMYVDSIKANPEILNDYDNSFGLEDFLKIVRWRPYIIELTFDGDKLIGKKDLAHVAVKVD